jgi:hypothetical protein
MTGFLGPFWGHRRAGVELDLSIMTKIGPAGGKAEKGLGSGFGGAQNQVLAGGMKWPAWGVLFLRRVLGVQRGGVLARCCIGPSPLLAIATPVGRQRAAE